MYGEKYCKETEIFYSTRQRYYWPKMRTGIINHVAQCLLEYPTPDGPFDTVAIDLLKLPHSHQGSTYVLVCVDHFSRFVVLAPLPNKSAAAVAHTLVSFLLCSYTTPSVFKPQWDRI